MTNDELEEGQIVMCTVEKILGTTVFVKIGGNGEGFHIDKNKSDNNMESQIEGTINVSEISPGRIRNLRDYVVPGKRIVCKILNIKGDKIHLSLRRVKQNEKKELLDKISKEKSYKAILKTILKDNTEEIIKNIENQYSILDLFSETKINNAILEKFISKSDVEKILKIIETKKEKPKEIRIYIQLSNDSSDGINIIKNILKKSIKESKCDISYIAAGKYRLSLIGNDFKEIKNEMNIILESIEKSAKKQNCEFEILKV